MHTSTSPARYPGALKNPLRRPAADTHHASFDADIFVFDDSRRDDDFDVIADFRPGIDKIDLGRTAKFRGADFADLLDAIEQSGSAVVIDLGAGTLTLEGVDFEDLSDEDFIF